ncbi:MAG: SIS domain-containing protein [Opitutaceae bacterium]|nr:SIS domain-containing protein [Opitutaceae bacterium]
MQSLARLNGPYLNDLLDQPRAVATTLAGMPNDLAPPRVWLDRHRVVLTGMGSSLHALNPLQLRLVAAGHTALLVETAELVHSQSALLDPRSLVVAVSQSGRSAETVQLLDLIANIAPSGRPHVIGVTNTADSPLALRADALIQLRAGPEFSVSCKTYLATIVGLEWLGALLLGADLRALGAALAPTPDAISTYLAAWPAHVRELAAFLAPARSIFLTGRGTSLAAVGAGALILKESTRMHAEGMSAPSFRHGPLEMTGPELALLAFEGEAATADLNRRLVVDVRAAGGLAALIGPSAELSAFRLPTLAPEVRPLFEMLAAQMVSLALALLRDREPGRFERATKVTIVA